MTPLHPLSRLHPYQVRAIKHVINHPSCALWLDMGLGKTIVTLCALTHWFDSLLAFGALVVAPKMVCETVWEQEARAWAYTQGLTFQRLTGSRKKREQALRKPAQIYLINYENLPWLVEEVTALWTSRGLNPPFDVTVLDELPRMKSTRTRQGGVWGRALSRLLPFLTRRIGLTGSPASEGFLDLFGQYLCLDGGVRLGTSYSDYQRKFFYQTDWNGYKWAPFKHSESAIKEKVGDITLSMRNEEYLNLPPLIVRDMWVDMPAAAAAKYEKMEKEFFLELDSGATVEIANEASLCGRCLQFANGAVFKSPGSQDWEKVHDAKLSALEGVLEEAAGDPILLFYQFRHDAYRITKKWGDAVWVHGDMKKKELEGALSRWNEGKVRLLVGHAAAIGHGMNLQGGSSTLVWFGIGWPQGLYSQAIARLRRQGQVRPVTMHRIFTRGTLDDAQRISMQHKQSTETSLRRAVEEYRRQKEAPEGEDPGAIPT